MTTTNPRDLLDEAVRRWQRSEPGSRSRKEAADEIEQLETIVFGNRAHALGKLLEEILT